MYKFLTDKHVHTLGGEPLYGTSTAVGILSKPLTYWAAGMALEPLGWRNPKKTDEKEASTALENGLAMLQDMELEEYGKLLDKCYRAHDTKKKEAASDGTDLHAELERFVKMCLSNGAEPLIVSENDWDKKVVDFSKWAIENVSHFLFSEGHTYSKEHWVGGIVDCGAHMKNGMTALLDFKSSKEAYYSQFVQLGGYAIQVEEQGIVSADGDKILEPMTIDELIVLPFSSKLAPKRIQNVAGFKDAFIGALTNYKLSKSFEQSM